MDDYTLFGLSLSIVGLPILFGLGLGLLLPLRTFIRSKLYFTIEPNDRHNVSYTL